MKPIAIAISDLHLSLAPPACRADKDWLGTQAHYLRQVRAWATNGLPVLCAGDIFDRWNPAPELLHFALEHLPDGMICVPGQHDLPNHRMDQMHRCGYGVLAKAGKIKHLKPTMPYMPGGYKLMVHGFGWNENIAMLSKVDTGPTFIHVALIHKYCWLGESYPGALAEENVAGYSKILRGYDVAVFGDNHKGFLKELKNGTVVSNCGGFIRRKSDEIHYSPSLTVIYNNGTVGRERLDTSIDQFHANAKAREETALDLKGFIDSLEGLGEHGLNFREAVENHLRTEELPDQVQQIILQSLNE